METSRWPQGLYSAVVSHKSHPEPDAAQKALRALNKVVAPSVRAGLGNPPPVGGGAIILETVGRTSGLGRRVPLLAARLGDRLVVSTVRGDSQWVRNIEADPAVTVWLYGKARPFTAVVKRGAITRVVLTLDRTRGR